MFRKSSLLVLSSSLFLAARAEVTPSAPGPGDVFNAGSTCTIAWSGDSDSTTAWKDMAIELMTGSNLGMVHLTTVATGQDGTVDGTFSWTCPDVTPNAAIYFYQFTSPHIQPASTQWTTRYTIASSSGQTVDPENATQPNGDSIPWGTGALADPSTASPPPDFASTPVVSASGSVGPASSSASAPVTPSASSRSTTTALSTVRMTTTSGSASSVSGSAGSSSPSQSAATGNSNNDNGALSFKPGHTGAFAAGALLFALLL